MGIQRERKSKEEDWPHSFGRPGGILCGEDLEK